MTRIRPRLTYANVVATLALFLALAGGSVYAAGKISGSDIKANTITGKQVRESTLKGVNAASVGGLRVKKIRFDAPYDDGGPPYAPVLSLGGLKITAACRTFGDLLDVKASTTKNGAFLLIGAISANSGVDDTNGGGAGMDSGNPAVNIDNFFPGVNTGDESIGTLHYWAPDGSVVVVHLALDEGPTRCTMTGTAIGA